jgi:hypothetical protein
MRDFGRFGDQEFRFFGDIVVKRTTLQHGYRLALRSGKA